jgi:lipopolysaccharide export system protein LptA
MTRALLLAALLAALALAPALAASEKPEVAGRNGAKPDAAKPDAAKPDVAKPGAAKPGAAKPGAAKPAEANPGEQKPPESKPAEARPARGGVALPGGESREPITIDADSLEWFDKEQKAIYTGNVVAKQGEATLKATQLRIFMQKPQKNGASEPAPAAPAAAGPGVAGDNQIERMEADGPVELIQKDQTATGDKGLFERGTNAVTLIGNVSLRQGGHITLGDRLVYDLDTRQAVIQKPRGTFAPRNQPAPAPKR